MVYSKSNIASARANPLPRRRPMHVTNPINRLHAAKVHASQSVCAIVHWALIISGQSTAFEATVNVEIRQDGTLEPLTTGIVMGGSNGEMGPFSKVIPFTKPTAARGAIILKTMSAKDGNIAEASVVRVQFS